VTDPAPKRILVTGAGGQLGLDVLDSFAEHEVVGLTHAELDVADRDAVHDVVAEHAPEVVIHCAAWTAVDACEQDPAKAHRVNALGPWWFAQACEASGAHLVTISTDYVFNGRIGDDPSQTRPWTEFDPVDPISEYGRSKAAGEALVRETTRRHSIVRTAWVCGARGNNFVRTMLRVGKEHGVARVVDDQWGSPTFTRDLAQSLREIADRGAYGTWNRTGRGSCTWFDLAKATYEDAGVEVELSRMPSGELDRPAPRPAWSVLSDQHAEASGLTPLPPWRASLRELLAELGELRDGLSVPASAHNQTSNA
jgi:dTDP-4-dehydrorhamnose reductase